jgi:hypothetical protein
MTNRRNFLACAAAAAAAPGYRPLVNAYYFRAHMYTMVPRHIREDLRWMADNGASALSLAVLEQDLFAAVENIRQVCNEAAKLNLKVFATLSRWGGLTAGAPKVPSLFSANNPDTWILDEDGAPYPAPLVSGVISSVHHPRTYEFFCESLDEMFRLFPFSGMIWDEPKGFRVDYSKHAIARLGKDAPKAAHMQATADFYGRVSRYVRTKHPGKTISMFIQVHTTGPQVEMASRIPDLDYFGCDGRPWDIEEDRQWASSGETETGKGKVLIGKGERFQELARKSGKKSLFLMENHNLPAAMIPAMDAGIPRVLAMRPDQLIYYYYPRNIGDPERNMAVIGKHLRSLRALQ